MAGHHLHQHVKVSDDGRTVAAAEVIISGEPGGTARVPLRAEAGHITPGAPAGRIPARRWRAAAAGAAALPGRQHPPGGVPRPAGCEPSGWRRGPCRAGASRPGTCYMMIAAAPRRSGAAAGTGADVSNDADPLTRPALISSAAPHCGEWFA